MTLTEEEQQRKLESITRSSEDRHERLRFSKRYIAIGVWFLIWVSLPLDDVIFYPIFGVRPQFIGFVLIGLLIYFLPPLVALGFALSKPGQHKDNP